jgi:hypothetical protein
MSDNEDRHSTLLLPVTFRCNVLLSMASMVKQVVVRSTVGGNTREKQTRPRDQLFLGVLAAPAVLAAASWGQWQAGVDIDSIAPGRTIVAAIASLFIALICLYLWWRPRTGDDDVQVAVAVYPIGIQLFKRVNGVPQGEPVFLARDEIRDCVVNEFILSYKVRSVVMFRVYCSDPETSKTSTRLVEAFPNVEMTFTECLKARTQITAYLQQSHQK